MVKREAAHYFLLATALSDYMLTGNSRNVRILLNHIYIVFGSKKYAIKNPSELTCEIAKFGKHIEKFDHLGQAKQKFQK